jgi:hypothetical protein
MKRFFDHPVYACYGVVNASIVICSAMDTIHIEQDVQQIASDVWRPTPDLSHSAYLQTHGWQTGGLVPEGCPCVYIYSDYTVKPSF